MRRFRGPWRLYINAIMIAMMYSCLLFRHLRTVSGQASQPYDPAAVFREIAGPNSGPLATGYADRAKDQAPDPLTKKERIAKERRLSGSFSMAIDPGELVEGRRHDFMLQVVDVFNPPGPVPTVYAKAILTARLKSARAFAAKDFQSVYSESYFDVTQIYKSDDARLRLGSRVITTRIGGSIIFPSGHQRDYIEENEGVPKVGSEYILFLWRPATARRLDYGICAAYEMRDGRLYPLDPGVASPTTRESPPTLSWPKSKTKSLRRGDASGSRVSSTGN